jgi:hypothetical protein
VGLSYVQVSLGRNHSVARRSDGSVVAWGSNAYGVCNVPVLPPGLSSVDIAASFIITAARRPDGTLVVWGDNSTYQLGVPPQPAGLWYVEVALGAAHVLARRNDGRVLSWGQNHIGLNLVPQAPPGISYVEIATGQFHSVARRSDDAVVAWGYNVSGQCTVPTLESGWSFFEIDAHYWHTAARLGRTGSCSITPSLYCVSKLNSQGCLPVINYEGDPRSSASAGFVVHATQVLNNKSGLLLLGTNGRAAVPFQAGTLCVNAPIHRTPLVNAGGNLPPTDCSGVFAIDMNRYAAGGPLPALSVAGTVVNCQWWGRDSGFAAPNNTSLSAGLEYTVCP